jgi:hypothetical protein
MADFDGENYYQFDEGDDAVDMTLRYLGGLSIGVGTIAAVAFPPAIFIGAGVAVAFLIGEGIYKGL